MEEKKMIEPEQQPEKSKKGSSVLVIFLIIIIIAMGCVIGYLVMNSRDKETSSGNKEEQQTETEEINFASLTEIEAQKLIGQIPIPFALEWKDTGFLDKKVTTSDMDINHLMYIAMHNVNRQGYETCTTELTNANRLCDFTLKVEDVKSSFEKLYGTSLSITDKVDGKFLWHCTRVNDLYACSNSGGGYCTAGSVYEYFGAGFGIYIRKYQKAEKDENNLYVYVKFARIEIEAPSVDEGGVACAKDWKPEEVTVKMYKYGTGDELITSVNGKDYYEENATKILEDKLYDQFSTQFTDYKITYKINGTNYSLVSVEPVK